MNCRSCGADILEPIISIGDIYLSDFRDDDEKPPRYPLNLLRCPGCHLVQLDRTVPRELLYHERYGFKSGVNDTIRADLRDVVKTAYQWVPKPRTWLDIACNDGTLLRHVSHRVDRYGCDPVEKYAREAQAYGTIHNDYFGPALYANQRFDVITSISMFYDIDDLNAFVAGVESILAPKGLWIVQQNYFATSLDLGAVDNICHEHITYFTLLALENLLDRHGLEVVDVSTSGINGGSFRTLIARRGVFEPRRSVEMARLREKGWGLDTEVPYRRFAWKADGRLASLGALVKMLARDNVVYVYGASTRGQILLQAAELGVEELPFAVDRNHEKVGKKIAGLGIPIVSEKQAREDHPHFMLVTPWFFRDEFLKREHDYLARGGKFIFPLPKLEVVG